MSANKMLSRTMNSVKKVTGWRENIKIDKEHSRACRDGNE